MEIHPTKHLTELKLVSLLSQHKLTLKDKFWNFPQGHISLLNDSKDHEKQDILETIGNFDTDDNIAIVTTDYEKILKQLDKKLGKRQFSKTKVKRKMSQEQQAVGNGKK